MRRERGRSEGGGRGRQGKRRGGKEEEREEEREKEREEEREEKRGGETCQRRAYTHSTQLTLDWMGPPGLKAGGAEMIGYT